eukprot:m.121627 g.121627  ORF g.121627 m.121627 type:complete len:696 (+) comp12924_c0_seq4:1622-3709(+)
MPSKANVLDDMHCVKPRLQSIYIDKVLRGNVPSQHIQDVGPPFALHITAKKLLMEHKVTINTRIVVVNASATALGCIEELCFRSHLCFNNIVIISSNGCLPSRVHESDNPRNRFLAADNLYTKSRLDKLSLQSSVSIVRGDVVSIEREEKFLTLADGDEIHYDFLLYLPDLKYTAALDDLQEQHPPYGVFAPNTQDEVDDMLEQVLAYEEDNDGAVVVIFGSSVDAYSAIAAIIDVGVDPHRVTLVKSIVDDSNKDIKARLPTADVERFVDSSLQAMGVSLHDPCTINRYKVDATSGVCGAMFSMANGSSFSVSCNIFVNMSNRTILKEDFLPLCESFFVFDGGLRIDNTFATNDPFVFSAGSFAKYTRKLYADTQHHVTRNPEDCGRGLAVSLARSLDPLEHTQAPGKLDLPKLTAPRVCISRLPGGFQLIHAKAVEGGVKKTQVGVGIEASSFVSTDRELVSGSFSSYMEEEEELEEEEEKGDNYEEPAQRHQQEEEVQFEKEEDSTEDGVDAIEELALGFFGDRRFFSILVDEFGFVSGVTCLCKGTRDLSHFVRLIGLHEKHLNNLVSRYNEGLIPDFYEFFMEPWAVAIFHDRFYSFTQTLSSLVKDTPESDYSELEEVITDLTRLSLKRLGTTGELKSDELKSKEEEQFAALRERVNTSSTQKMIKDRLLDFITFHAYHLPMYARPNMW